MARVDRARGRRPRAAAPPRLLVLLDGLQLRVRRRETARLVEGVQRRRGTHNEQRPAARAALPRPARRALQGGGDPLVPTPRRRRARPPTSRASSTATTRSTRASPARSCAARRCPKAGSRSCARASAAGPRCRKRSNACGRCSRAPSWSTTCSGSRRSCARPRDGLLTDDEQALLHRARARDVTAVAWTEDDVALIDEADALLGPVEAARPRRPARARRRRRARPARRGSSTSSACTASPTRPRSPRRNGGAPPSNGAEIVDRAPHVRPRARRRSAGPHRDAVADARPPVPVGLDDPRRRSRPGQPARRARLVVGRARAPAPAHSGPLRHAHHQLPHAGRGHGGRGPAARGRGADRRAVALGAQHRRAAALRHDVARPARSTRPPHAPAPRSTAPERSR